MAAEIVRAQLIKLKERGLSIQSPAAEGILKLFTSDEQHVRDCRSMITAIDSLQAVFGSQYDANILYMIMLCLPPSVVIALFPSLAENIWAICRPAQKHTWRTREYVKMSNDLASTGLLFALDRVPPAMLRMALLYFTANREITDSLIAMRDILNIDARVFAAMNAVRNHQSFDRPQKDKDCIRHVHSLSMYNDPRILETPQAESSFATLNIVFEPTSAAAPTAFDIISNVFNAIGIQMPEHISTKATFGNRKIVILTTKYMSAYRRDEFDFMIPFEKGVLCALDPSRYWFAAGELPHSLRAIVEFYKTLSEFHAPDFSQEDGMKILKRLICEVEENEELYNNRTSDMGILMLLSTMKQYNDDDEMPNEYAAAAIRSMMRENPRFCTFMLEVALIAEKQQYGTPNMMLNSMLMKCAPIPRYVDPCIWACMSAFSVGDQEWIEAFGPLESCENDVDFITQLYNESVREVERRLTWDPDESPAINNYGDFI